MSRDAEQIDPITRHAALAVHGVFGRSRTVRDPRLQPGRRAPVLRGRRTRGHARPRGDYRIEALKADGGFRIDNAAVRDACELLGIGLPVDVRFSGRVGPTNGSHAFDGERHRIMLKSYLTPEQATRTLWHELTHAMQAERAGSVLAWGAFSRAQRSYSYSNRPIELEARRMADVMGDLPLCVGRD